MSIWDDVAAEFACSHEHCEIRYSIASNGVRQFREQCIACGELSQFLKHSDPRVMAIGLPIPIDESLREAHQQAISLEVQRRYAVQNDLDTQERLRERDEEETRWWAQYNAYLESDDWQARRRMVLERDKYLCQACLRERASQAHHLTYRHVFEEPLFDLIAVCETCHRRITVLDRERRRVA